MGTQERLMANIKINPETGCWEWQGQRNGKGYGSFSLKSQTLFAHRLAYVLLKGTIPAGMELDHVCRVRHCINPDHLEPVTHQENVQRGIPFRERRQLPPSSMAFSADDDANTEYCPGGRHMLARNTIRYSRGRRTCRLCEFEAKTRMRGGTVAELHHANS